MWRGGQRNVALTGKKRGGGVEPNPTGPRDVDLSPGVQISEVLRWAGRAIQARLVSCELDEVTRDESSRQPTFAAAQSPTARPCHGKNRFAA